MPNYQGVWSLSTQYQNAGGWPSLPINALNQLGSTGGTNTQVDYINLATTGNATDFGDTIAAAGYRAAASSTTRALFAGGYDGSILNQIEFTTIASTGSFADFGDILATQYGLRGLSNSTRGVIGGGDGAGTASNVMQ